MEDLKKIQVTKDDFHELLSKDLIFVQFFNTFLALTVNKCLALIMIYFVINLLISRES